MSDDRQWLDMGLEALPAAAADRVRLFRLLLAEAAQLRARLDRELAPSGVTVQQGVLLSWIEARSAPPTIGEVAAGLGMTHQNVKQIAAALERKGLLEIVVDEADRRARRLVLTAQHRRFWKRRNPNDFSQVQSWLAAFDDDEVRSLLRLLGRLHRHLKTLD